MPWDLRPRTRPEVFLMRPPIFRTFGRTTMSTPNHYDVLEIDRSASTAAIQSAYRRLAMRWHPDRNKHPAATARFRKINEAYQTLRNPTARAAYDAMLWRAGAGAEAHARRSAGHEARGNDRARTEACHDGCIPCEVTRVLESLMPKPETLMMFFARVDDGLRRAFARARK